MRLIARIDKNQNEIVQALRKIGASVISTAPLGNGFCDIVVGYRGKNYLFEIKSSTKAKLTHHEEKFKNTWSGQYSIIYSFDDALKIITP